MSLRGTFNLVCALLLVGCGSSLHASRAKEIAAQNKFMIFELARVNEKLRQQDLEAHETDVQQTLESFDYQWGNLASGDFLPDDPKFMAEVKQSICTMTGLPADWFPGKRVIDIGCGVGRYTYGLLALGAEVTACDASEAGVAATRALCKEFGERCQVFRANIVEEALPEKSYDLAFCYGVVHHTGNTYLAIKKVCDAAKAGGKVFLMVYGYPEQHGDYVELNEYEALRQELRPLSFEAKIERLKQKFPKAAVHGWFDAVSPQINDLMRFGELVELLNRFGITEIQRTAKNRNLHVVGEKKC
jgi:SAM-dependent methyltransferase